MIKVGVLGAAGRMGREVCRAAVATDDLELVAAVDPHHAGLQVEGLVVAADRDGLSEADVAVDFTRPDAVLGNARWCLEHGVHVVIGTSGVPADAIEEVRRLADDGAANAFVAPNFALGAVLLMRFAEQAAHHFDAVEVIELHHDGKADAPSGTAMSLAERIGRARAGDRAAPGGDGAHPGARGAQVDGIAVHSVRLPGSLAHHEAIFGGPGQTLTIRHDSTDRASFLPGVLMAIRAVGGRPGLTVGLDALMD